MTIKFSLLILCKRTMNTDQILCLPCQKTNIRLRIITNRILAQNDNRETSQQKMIHLYNHEIKTFNLKPFGGIDGGVIQSGSANPNL